LAAERFGQVGCLNFSPSNIKQPKKHIVTEHLQHNGKDEDAFLARKITGDET
jgi:hypothetical protein